MNESQGVDCVTSTIYMFNGPQNAGHAMSAIESPFCRFDSK